MWQFIGFKDQGFCRRLHSSFFAQYQCTFWINLVLCVFSPLLLLTPFLFGTSNHLSVSRKGGKKGEMAILPYTERRLQQKWWTKIAIRNFFLLFCCTVPTVQDGGRERVSNPFITNCPREEEKRKTWKLDVVVRGEGEVGWTEKNVVMFLMALLKKRRSCYSVSHFISLSREKKPFSSLSEQGPSLFWFNWIYGAYSSAVQAFRFLCKENYLLFIPFFFRDLPFWWVIKDESCNYTYLKKEKQACAARGGRDRLIVYREKRAGVREIIGRENLILFVCARVTGGAQANMPSRVGSSMYVWEREWENYKKKPGAIECRGSRESFLIASDAFSQKTETIEKKGNSSVLSLYFISRPGREIAWCFKAEIVSSSSSSRARQKKTLPEFLTPSVFSFLFPPNMRRPTTAAAVAK